MIIIHVHSDVLSPLFTLQLIKGYFISQMLMLVSGCVLGYVSIC